MLGMKINKVVLRKMRQPLKHGFQTSFADMKDKAFTVVELYTADGYMTYSECSAIEHPWYNEETRDGAFEVIKRYLIPALFDMNRIEHPEEFYEATNWIRRNKMARAAIDCGLWSLYAQERGLSLAAAIGGTRSTVEVGVSLGIQPTPDDLCRTIEGYLEAGYRRIKCKIKPNYDLDYIKQVRREFGDIMLMADANSAYTLDQIETFKALDEYNLLMIEQPLASDDIVDHRHLQQAIHTPICLDESIDSVEDARKAIELGSCKTINIKLARVGGITEAKKIHDLCAAHNIPVWSGGMLDTGIARAYNLAIASLPNYSLPHDIPDAERYWAVDLVRDTVKVGANSSLTVPTSIGLGMSVASERVEQFTEERVEFVR